MTSKPNIYRDDLDVIAFEIVQKIEAGRRQTRIVWVSPEGFVSSTLQWEAAKAKLPRPDTDIVGAYNREATFEQIRDDLKARMAEVAHDMLRRAA